MKIMNIKKALKISILMTVILALPIMYTLATESAISYTLSEDKKSAMIHIDVNKIIGDHELAEVKDQDDNLLTEYDMTVTENGTYSYTVTYKEKDIKETVAEESESVAYTQDTTETPEEEIIVKSEKLEITVTDIELKEESKINEDTETTQPLQTISEEELNVTVTSVETDAKYFEFDAATGTITKFKRDVTPAITDVVIPVSINGTTVKNIGREAFMGSKLVSVKFPTESEVDNIGVLAFSNNQLLKEIILPEKLEVGGSDMLSNCVSLEKIRIPESLTKIDTRTFSFCNKLEEVIIPNTVTNIGYEAFAQCTSLKEINLPDSLTILGIRAFSKCENLLSINIPDNVTTIKDSAFEYCTALQNVFLPSTLSTLEQCAFRQCTSLKEIIIPDSIQKISAYTFLDCYSLETVELSSQLTFINVSAFENCKSLSQVEFKNGITRIEDYAFQSCINLKKINLPASLEIIGEEAFEGCALPSANFDDLKNNISVADNAFSNQKAVISMYHTSQGDYINFNEYTPFSKKIVLSDANFTMLDNGVAKANIKNPNQIIYSYPMLGELGNVQFSATATFHTLFAYKAQFICDENILEEKFVLEDEEIEFPVIPEKEGYTAFWDKNNKTIQRDEVFTVVYKIKPYLDGSNRIEINQDSLFDPNDTFIFKDADGNIIKNATFTGQVNTNRPGEYSLEYEVIDQWGGKTQGQCFITVKPKEGNKDEIVFPGEDGEIGTDDDIIVKPGTIDNNGNVIIPDGGTIIYPDGSHEDFPNGGIILPGEDEELGTKDDIIVKPGIIDDNGNIIIPDGGIIIYPDGSHKDFPDGGIVLPGEDGKSGTKDDVIVKDGNIDDKGNIIISAGGEILYPDGRIEKLPNGGILYAGSDGIFGTKDDQLIKNRNQESIDISKENQLFENVITGDNTYLLLWSLVGLISLVNIMILMKRKKLGSENRQ